MFEITQDINGKQSSKRTAGLIILGLGVLLILAIGVYSFFAVLKDPVTSFNCAIALLTAGGGLLGITIGEYIGTLIKKK